MEKVEELKISVKEALTKAYLEGAREGGILALQKVKYFCDASIDAMKEEQAENES